MDGRGRVRLGQIHLDSTYVQGVGGTVALAQIYMQADDRKKVVSNNHIHVTHSMLAIRDESSKDEKDNAKLVQLKIPPWSNSIHKKGVRSLSDHIESIVLPD